MNRQTARTPLTCLVALLLLVWATWARAGAPLAATQVPGYYRLMHGQFEVTALFDGALQLDASRLTHAKPEDVRQLLARMFVGTEKMQTAVNAYLINTGSHLVLVDAGGGRLYGAQLGKVPANLKAAGYTAEQVDTVIVTHMHGDHIAGLLRQDGQPLFPNATIHAAQAESDFWLSAEQAARAPESMQRTFVAARNTARPYQSQGKWRTFTPGTQIVPGITAVDTRGHTPGHTAFAVETQGRKLLIWGDLVHSHAVQFARPDVAIEYDVDQNQAIATRMAIFQRVAASGELVAGMHLPFPGIGHVRANRDGSYSWVPVEYAPLAP